MLNEIGKNSAPKRDYIPQIYLVATKYCNLACSHCYIRAGPHQKNTTMSLQDFESLLGNLPKKMFGFVLGGGEVSITDQFSNYVFAIERENSNRTEGNKILTRLQSNGVPFFNNFAPAIFNSLLESGIVSLDLSSNDDYHRRAGD